MLTRDLKKAWIYLRSLPTSFYFNYKYFGFRQALRFPVLLSHRVALDVMQGSVVIENPVMGGIKIGFDKSGLSDPTAYSVWQVAGTVIFKGRARLGPALKLVASAGGTIIFGENFNAGNDVSIYCASRITFGNGALLSWNVTVMDHDFHEIHDQTSKLRINHPREIFFGDNVWIGCNSMILKGGGCDDNCIVAAGSMLNKRMQGEGCIIGGNPPRVLKSNVYWKP